MRTGSEGNTDGFHVDYVGEISPTNAIFYEIGKEYIVESSKTVKEFCRFMIGVSTGGIPIYTGILGVILKDQEKIELSWTIIIIPAIFLLSSSIVFAFGYMPRSTQYSISSIDQIVESYYGSINYRRKMSVIGFILFCIGTILSSGVLFYVIRHLGALSSTPTPSTG